MALTRAQLLMGNSAQGTVLAGEVQGVKSGTGITIAADGTISVDSQSIVGVMKLGQTAAEAAAAYNSYDWPNATGTVGQQLTITAVGGGVTTLDWGDPDQIPWTAKGQLVVGTGANTQTLLNVGANGSILIADSTQASGLAYTSNFVATTGATGAAIMPTGNTVARPGTPAQGYTRYNTDLLTLEAYDGTTWEPVQSTLTGGLSVDITADVAKGYTQTASAPPTVGALPTDAIEGSMYWDDNLGALFIYYNDGTSSQWVQAIA